MKYPKLFRGAIYYREVEEDESSDEEFENEDNFSSSIIENWTKMIESDTKITIHSVFTSKESPELSCAWVNTWFNVMQKSSH